jgi:predicted Zn finger-like uncharacterized protein
MGTTIDCPSCSRKLRVTDELLGSSVRCPACGVAFTATDHSAPPPPAPPPPSPPPPSPPPDRQRVSSRSLSDELEIVQDGDDRPPYRGGFRRDMQEHRGTLILVLGILSLVTGICGVFLGPIAWVMGNHDLQEMREGRMDPEGKGMTDAGRICGMIASILVLAGIVVGCGFFALMMAAGARGF